MLSKRPAAAERLRTPQGPSQPVCCLSLRAAAEIGVMARVIQALARRSLLPSRWHSTEAGELLLMDLQISDLPEAEGVLLAEALRQIVGVEEVLTARFLRRTAA
jgi:hypothetical protein